jgi:glycosyltransferase involved in cell wall biosynthesis
MKLNVIIPTYNRAKLLSQTLRSVENAHVPSNLEIEVIVVNNNSDDETEKVVKELQKSFSKTKIKYLFEVEQGRSSAVNTGINNADGDLIAMIDDDIQIEKDWFLQIEKIFSECGDEIDFIGGKVLPIWEIEPPDWVKAIRDVGVCWRDYGEEEWKYSYETPILTGGHAVFKAEIFSEVGRYAEELGVKKKNLASCEDDVMFEKLLEAGKRGIYSPKLIVHHYVPAHRLTKNYYRQWHFGAGMSWNTVEKSYRHYDGAKIFGTPRYLYKGAIKGLLEKIGAVLTFNKVKSLRAEKEILIFLGFFYARNILESKFNNPLQKLAKRTIRIAER